MWKQVLCLCFLTYSLTGANPVRSLPVWWDNSIIYQIYPRSFKDSDGDGIGDLNGITSKLEHIREIADTFWLSPIYTSPQRDFGYDVSNFVDINPEYGTLEDFDELVAKAKSLGLRILMDFVPNHSSDEHEWFKKSVQRIEPYDDFYIWKNARISPNGTRLPPNNWLSMFGGSAWEWNEERGQYYYHQFVTSQPDLNYRNLQVQKEMKNVLKFWLDRGIDGFRVDAVVHLFEDLQFLNEPRSSKLVPADDYDYLEHIYTRDLDETYAVVRSWRTLADDYSLQYGTDKKVFLMEVGSTLPYVMRYYDVGTNPFNFGFIHTLNNDSTAMDFKNNIDDWIYNMPKGEIANWIVGNHDVHRVASRFGHDNNRADQMSMLSAVLPGITIIYNGDEIGMVNRYFTYKETIDPAGCNAGPERYQLKSRDPERTPYQWDNTVSAGFSSNPNPWLPVHENYKVLNLVQQKMVDISHYKVFQALAYLKKIPIMEHGTLKVFVISDQILAVIRRHQEFTPVVLLINFADDVVKVDVQTELNIPPQMTIYVASVKSGLTTGETVSTSSLSIPGSASVILTSHQLVSTLLNTVQ